MTITVSIEELQAHEMRVQDWCLARLRYYLKLIEETRCVVIDGRFQPLPEFKEKLDAWTEEHPAPKLIPSV